LLADRLGAQAGQALGMSLAQEVKASAEQSQAVSLK